MVSAERKRVCAQIRTRTTWDKLTLGIQISQGQMEKWQQTHQFGLDHLTNIIHLINLCVYL